MTPANDEKSEIFGATKKARLSGRAKLHMEAWE
ncbi:hypothetical protein VIBR0546_12707 [Vibrio brasiliensis LMG 20546]|uniref:Uncharacterized protein n=1 Tax=Vibrio brasiliensis LMG 20546 TaxID=945543 RepID=E8LP36_9VIBR|nr:hypothetical protein VIBR0546_12707 [Vibrio brasiliensis LMG 20546]